MDKTYFKSVSKFNPGIYFFSSTEYWSEDIKCMAKVYLNFYFQVLKFLVKKMLDILTKLILSLTNRTQT